MVAGLTERPRAFARARSAPETPKPTAKVGPEAKEVAKVEGASFVTQLTFKQNSYDLTDVAQKLLRDLVAKASTAGKVQDIHLIVWADQEYPSTERGRLGADEVRLADRRAKALFDFLRERKVKANVEAYNMAERPNPIQSFLSTADARIKKTLEGAGMATTAQDLSAPEYASKAIVLVLLAK